MRCKAALLHVADLDAPAAVDALFPGRRVLLDYWVRRNVVVALHAQLGRVRTPEDRLLLERPFEMPSSWISLGRLVADPGRRRALRLGLREAIRRSRLGDTQRWVRDFEALTVRTLEAAAGDAGPVGA